MTTFSGPAGVATFRAVSLRSGINLYAKTGMRPNRAWTPTAMLKAAGVITGQTYRRGQYAQAVADLTAWLDANGTTGEGELMARCTECPCGSGEWPDAQFDGYGIFLCYTCRKCERETLAKYRRDIFTRYEADEPIEPDE